MVQMAHHFFHQAYQILTKFWAVALLWEAYSWLWKTLRHLIICFYREISCLRDWFTSNPYFMPALKEIHEAFLELCLVQWLLRRKSLMNDLQNSGKTEYCNDFELRKLLERHFYSGQRVDCISLRDSPDEWDMLSFIRSLKGMVRSSGAVAKILLGFQKLPAGHLISSLKLAADEDKELAKLLTGYQDMLGLLSVHKIASINTQVPAILEARTFSMKLRK